MGPSTLYFLTCHGRLYSHIVPPWQRPADRPDRNPGSENGKTRIEKRNRNAESVLSRLHRPEQIREVTIVREPAGSDSMARNAMELSWRNRGDQAPSRHPWVCLRPDVSVFDEPPEAFECFCPADASATVLHLNFVPHQKSPYRGMVDLPVN